MIIQEAGSDGPSDASRARRLEWVQLRKRVFAIDVLTLPSCVPNLTDAQCRDSDGDGIIEDWELHGHDMNHNGVIDPGEDFPAMGAHPMRIDVFVEADCMVASDHSHCPTASAIQDVVQSFANAPVVNFDNTHGVQLHVDVGPLYGAGSKTTVPNSLGSAAGTFGDFGGGGNQIAEAGNTIINFTGVGGKTSMRRRSTNAGASTAGSALAPWTGR
jgi:hypothetical protein